MTPCAKRLSDENSRPTTTPGDLRTASPAAFFPSSIVGIDAFVIAKGRRTPRGPRCLDAFLVALCVCAFSLVFFPQIIQRAAQSFVAAVTRYGSLVDLPGPSRVAEEVCWALCVFDYKTALCSAPPIGAKSANFKWHLALRCVALRCVALIWSAVDCAGCAAIRFKCESAVANMNRKMLLIYCDTNIH